MLKTLMLRSTLIACACVLSITAHAYAADRRPIDVPAGDLTLALEALAKQSGVELIYQSDQLKGIRTQGVTGNFSAEEAVTKLLEGTKLTLKTDTTGAMLIAPPRANGNPETSVPGAEPTSTPSAPPAANTPETRGPDAAKKTGWFRRLLLASADESEPAKTAEQRSVSEGETTSAEPATSDEEVDLGELVVTGTHIRGAEVSSPVVKITQEEMRLAGHNNLGEAIRALPQNFSGGQNPGVALGANVGSGGLVNQNVTGSSSFNLRGLGPDATLTLLNGTRLAHDGISQAVDVSVIPVAAIERIEVLLDGASAIYGSDAVGGVANIILKRDYEGVELSARFGGATDGGYEQQQYTAVAGTNWGSGGFLVTGDYSHNDSVRARHRDYLGQLADQDVTIYPQHTLESALLSGHQQIGASAEFQLDAYYTERSQETLDKTGTATFFIGAADSSIWGVAPSLDFALPGKWSARLHGAAGRNEAETGFTGFSAATGAQTFAGVGPYVNEIQAAGIETEGPLFTLPGGQARLSVGGGYRRSTFDFGITNLVTGVLSNVVAGEESSEYVYGEVDLPLMTRLSLNAALRHEEYDSFGPSTTPKIGVVWGLSPGFDLRASWGQSFKVPTLNQRYVATNVILDAGTLYGRPAGSQVLRRAGGNPDLDPEEAETLTAGFVARPEFMPGLTLEISYFDIDYTDRVARPIDLIAQALSNPVYAEFVTLNPTTAQQEAAFVEAGQPVGVPSVNTAGVPYDPARVVAIVRNQDRNIATQRIQGVDLIARYTVDLFGGNLSLSGNGDWITDATRELTEFAPPLPAAGVNFWPPKFRGSLGAGWSRQGFSLSANLYYADGITDRNVTPNVKRDSMTTVDLIVDYQWDSDFVGDVGFNLAVTNVFDEPPPFLQPSGLPTISFNYDSTNYSALGRVVSATITKRF